MSQIYTFDEYILEDKYADDGIRYYRLADFMEEVLGTDVDPWEDNDFFDFMEAIYDLKGPRNGIAKGLIKFRGATFEVARKRIKKACHSERVRWEVTVKKLVEQKNK